MHTITLSITEKGKTAEHRFTLPGGWQECTARQLCLAASALYTEDIFGDKAQYFMGTLLAEQADVRRVILDLNDLHAGQLAGLVEWIDTPFVTQKSLIATYEGLTGPGDNLKGFSIERLGFADLFCNRYADTGETVELSRLMGVLYCEAPEAWTEDHIDEGEILFLDTPLSWKLGALLNYRGLRANMVEAHPNVFEGGSSDHEMARFGWLGVIQDLAGDKFGPVSQAKRTPVPEAMAYFERQGIRVKRQKEEFERSKKRK